MRSFLYTLNIHVACMLVYNIIKQLKGVLQMFNGYQQMPMYNNNVQQQLAQQRMEQLQNQYNGMMQQTVPQQTMQMIKCRPVTNCKLPVVTAGTKRKHY